MMLKYCAWCGKFMGFVGSDRDGGVTHGMCQWCKDHEIKRFMERHAEESKNDRSIIKPVA